MSNNYWCPWENSYSDKKGDEIPMEKSSITLAISEEMQQEVLNYYGYFCSNDKKYGSKVKKQKYRDWIEVPLQGS